MIIYNPNGTPIIDIEVDDTSFCLQSIMDSDDVQLEFSLTEHVELPIGAYVEFQGNRYELLKDENVTINHSRDLSYKVLLSGPIGRAKNYIIHNPIDHRLKYDLIAKPADHLAMIVANLNERDGAGVWAVGACIEKNEVAISYNHTYCIDGLKQLADQCKTEFEITRRTATTFAVNLRKVEYYKDSPLALGYGYEKGFLPGISREESSEALEKVWIEGGDKNISLKEYGASILHLPKSLVFSFDGEKFEGETGYDSEKGVSMVTDADGYSVKLATAAVNATEGSLDVTSIYPSRTGLVKGLRFEYKKWYYTYEELIAAFPALTDEDWDAVQVDIIDSTIPADLDYSACLLPNGSPLLLTFQSGPLAGREFDVTFCKAAKTDTRVTEQGTQSVTRPANRFELKKADHDGISMPTRNFLPTAENEYIITNCYLPQAYISDPATFSGAEYDALREAAVYLYENKDKKRSYRGEIDSLFAKRNWLNVSSHLRLGAYISFSHPDVQPTPIAVRITSLKQFINKPEKPQIEISNGIVSLGKSTQIDELKNKEAHVEAATSSAVRVARRGFSDAKETARMLIDAALEGFDPEITPVAIQTMQLLAGDESLQFKFWTSRACTTPVSAPVTFNPSDKRVHYEACCLQHMTLGISDMAPSHELSEYKIWNMSAGESAVLVDPEKKYYAYAKVDAANDGQSHLSGQFVLSETAIPMRSVDGYYHLLVGILASEKEGDRSFANMFGFTEITPGQVLTDVIRSADGSVIFDLLQKSFNLGDKLKYNVNGSGQMVLDGAFVQTGSGEISAVGAYCGEFDNDRIYRLGDEVWKKVNEVVSTYRYVNSVPSKGHDVTDLSYWIYVAEGVKGEKGADGQSTFKSIVFKRTNTAPGAPEGGSYTAPVPSGWSDGVPEGTAQLWMSTRIFTSDGKSPQEAAWTAPRPATDTADIDFEFSAVETNPGTPETKPANWHNAATASDIWMAVRKCKNGVWGAWEVNKIKGEKGADGQDGRDGRDGHDGSDGSDGVGISSTEVGYQKSTNGTVVPSGNWQTTIPAIGAGEYLWTRLIVTYTNGETSTSYAVSRNGTNGTDGTNGRDGKDGAPGAPGKDGIDGKDGVNGKDGANGIGISSYIIDYQEGSNGTTIPQGTWTTKLSDVTVRAGFYLWTRTRITLTNGTTNTSYSNARQGLDGAKGADGMSPACPYRGNWSSGEVYYGMGSRTDIVFFSKADYSDGTNLYYIAKTTVGGPIPTGVKPTNTAYWSNFGANFDNIATGFAFIEQLVVRQLNTAGEGSSTKRIVAEGNTLAMYDDSNNKKMSISGENLVPAGESASYTYNSETLLSKRDLWPSSGLQLEGDGSSHSISVVSGNRVVVTTPVVSLSAGDSSYYPPVSGAATFVLSAFLYVNGDLHHIETLGQAINPSQSSVQFSFTSRNITLSLPSGTNTIKMFVRLTIGLSSFSPYGDYYTLNVSTGTWGAEVTYGTQSVDIGANGFRAMFGSSYMFQAIKTGSEDSTIEMLMRAGNYGVKMTSSGLQFLIGGSWYAASRVYDSTISGYVLKLG